MRVSGGMTAAFIALISLDIMCDVQIAELESTEVLDECRKLKFFLWFLYIKPTEIFFYLRILHII